MTDTNEHDWHSLDIFLLYSLGYVSMTDTCQPLQIIISMTDMIRSVTPLWYQSLSSWSFSSSHIIYQFTSLSHIIPITSLSHFLSSISISRVLSHSTSYSSSITSSLCLFQSPPLTWSVKGPSWRTCGWRVSLQHYVIPWVQVHYHPLERVQWTRTCQSMSKSACLTKTMPWLSVRLSTIHS